MSPDASDEARPEMGGLKRKVEMWAAVLLMAVGFGAGFLVRGMTSAPPPAGVDTGSFQGNSAPGGMIAPPLTDDQIQQQLPPGHPPVEGAPSPTGSPASPSPAPSAS
ncbi:MAG: hypothetical protein HY775_04980 [Acidobacteria bacterium]|nr:hypothetical protein [Acidobacteriota bacterium]